MENEEDIVEEEILTLKDAYKAMEWVREEKSKAIITSIPLRTKANKFLRLTQENPTFENETAYARAWRFVKDADDNIKNLHSLFLEKYKKYEEMKNVSE